MFRFRHASAGGTVLFLAAVTPCHLFSQWRGIAFWTRNFSLLFAHGHFFAVFCTLKKFCFGLKPLLEFSHIKKIITQPAHQDLFIYLF